MDNMSRGTFLKISMLGLVGATTPVNMSRFGANALGSIQDDTLLMRAVQANDLSVEQYINSLDRYERLHYYRPLSNVFSTFTASYCQPSSQYYRSQLLLGKMDDILDTLIGAQYPNGTMDSGGNRQSPPDTAFYLENMCPAAVVLMQAQDHHSQHVQNKLKAFLLKAGEGIRTGGVHTPNHRWIVSAMLARLYVLFQDDKYLYRLDEWLAEGVYLNEDGNYPERSKNYAIVEGNALLMIARLINRPELFEIVRKNLVSNYYYMEPNGDLVTIDSRRQDQNYTIEMARFYFLYKYLAHHYNDEFFAAIVKEIEGFDAFEKHVLPKLIVFMEDPVLLSEVPTDRTLPTNYTRSFPASSLVRIRRGDTTASIFGGNDKPIIIASGRSVNPTFFTFRKGAAILHSVRLSTSFFNMGYVRSDGVLINGHQYILGETKEAYYYHPMPPDKRNASGDYALSESVDGRFWSKMDFPSRPRDTIALESRIIITEDNGAFRMELEVDGSRDVGVILEFCFNKGGTLEGVALAEEGDAHFLTNGDAKYTFGDDVIEIGPGKYEHNNLGFLDGEMYSTHFGTIKGEGMHVYLTGRTPFKHSVTIK